MLCRCTLSTTIIGESVIAAVSCRVASTVSIVDPGITFGSDGGEIGHQGVSRAAVLSGVTRAVIIGLVAVTWAAALPRITLAKIVVHTIVSESRGVLNKGKFVIAAGNG